MKQINPEPRYVKLYFNSADLLGELTNNQFSLLVYLLSKSYDEGGVCRVVVDSELKQEAIFELGWKPATFDNALRGLKKASVIVKANKELYIFNPEVLEPR